MVTHPLVTYSVPFVGRSEELRQISDLLHNPACRLLTLIGPGGIGKTRLAVEAARLQSPHFPDGIFFVALQPLASSDLLVPAIGEGIHLQFYAGADPKQQLLEYLLNKSFLLVLDNFEHLLEGAELLSEILSTAPDVRMLVTSRERLNLLEEWVLEVPGLEVPSIESEIEIGEYSAVQLFLQNARQANVSFALSDSQKPAVARICRLVGGMPLGIELASAWVRALSCQEIADEIERSLDILAINARNSSPRHRNMRAAVEHSWNMLSPTEQEVFKSLSVFYGGFRKEAAYVVADASLPILSSLVDKSLLRIDANGRYQIHELLRQYAQEKLTVDSADMLQTHYRHCAYYIDFLSQHEADIKGRRQQAGLTEVEADFENIRAAWNWAVEHHNWDAIDQCLEGLRVFCRIRSHYADGKELFRYAQEQIALVPNAETDPVRGRLVSHGIGLKIVERYPQPYEDAQPLVKQALALARMYNDQSETAFCLFMLGLIAYILQDNITALRLFEESLALYQELDDLFFIGELKDFMGSNYLDLHDDQRCQEYSQESYELRRKIGDLYGSALALQNLQAIAWYRGEYDKVRRYLSETDAIYSQVGSQAELGRNKGQRARLAFYMGDFDQAQALVEAVLKSNVAMLSGKFIAPAILRLLVCMREDYAESAQIQLENLMLYFADWYYDDLLGAAVGACGLGDYQAANRALCTTLKEATKAIYITGVVTSILPIAVILLAHEGEKEQAVEVLGLVFNHSASATGWLEKWALFTHLRADLETGLSSEAFAAAWERGKASDLQTVVHSLIERFDNPADQSHPLSHPSLTEPLSGREQEVLHLIAEGLTNAEIAAKLFLSLGTVKVHVRNIFAKFNVNNRTQALAQAKVLHLL